MSVSNGVGRRLAGLRIALFAAAVAGALLLVASTFTTVLAIAVAGSTKVAAGADLRHSGWERHGPALLLLAALALVLAAGALRGSRPAAVAVAVCGLAALLIVLIGDAPDLHRTGFVGEVYADAEAGPGAGWYLETAGSVLLLLGGVALAVLGEAPARAGERPPAASRESRTAAREARRRAAARRT
jgi:hypothetical protein